MQISLLIIHLLPQCVVNAGKKNSFRIDMTKILKHLSAVIYFYRIALEIFDKISATECCFTNLCILINYLSTLRTLFKNTKNLLPYLMHICFQVHHQFCIILCYWNFEN